MIKVIKPGLATSVQDLGREVSVTAKSPPPADADQGSARKPVVTLDAAVTTTATRNARKATATSTVATTTAIMTAGLMNLPQLLHSKPRELWVHSVHHT